MAMADAFALLFSIQSCVSLCLDGSILVFATRGLVLQSLNRAHNGIRSLPRGHGAAASFPPQATPSQTAGTSGASVSPASTNSLRAVGRGHRRLKRRFKKSLTMFAISIAYHIFYVYFAPGAFAGPRAADASAPPSQAFADESSSVDVPPPSSAFSAGAFLFSTQQLLFATDLWASTSILSFVPALQPMSLWAGGGGGAPGGFLTMGTALLFLDLFLLAMILAFYAALEASISGGVCRKFGVVIFGIDDSSHISSLRRRGGGGGSGSAFVAAEGVNDSDGGSGESGDDAHPSR